MWKQQLLAFTEKFKHPAWGKSHFQRIYELSLQLAKEQGIEIDQEALFAAAYLHDIGAFDPYKKPGIDHAERSIQFVEDILSPMGFPLEKISLVKDIIRGHMFYENPASHNESVIFHDADVLDFMGIIGVTRLLSIVGLSDWAPDLRSAIELIQRFSKELLEKLHTPQARQIGKVRREEMQIYLKNLSKETRNLQVL
ncbi:MAG: HD domain-containing protein [Promethearchaeota archaeon]